LIGLAGLYQYTAFVRRAVHEQFQTLQSTQLSLSDLSRLSTHSLPVRSWHFLQSSLIYIPLVLLLALLAFTVLKGQEAVEHGLVLITAAAGTLVATRYFLT